MIFGIFASIFLIIFGLLAAPSIVLANMPELKEPYDKYYNIALPFLGIAGLVFAILGLWRLVYYLAYMPSFFKISVMFWMIKFISAVVQTGLGLLFGFGFVQKFFLSNNKEWSETGAKLIKKIEPFQGIMGVVAIVIGLVEIIITVTIF